MTSVSKILVSAAIAIGLLAACFSEDVGLPEDPFAIRPLLIGAEAPAFSGRDVSGQPWSFDPETNETPVILTFYRGSWCPYCTRHLMEYRHVEETLLELGYRLVFLTPDRPEVIAEGQAGETVNYEVVSDSLLEAATAFGVAFRLDSPTVARYAEAGIDLTAASGEDHKALPVPSTWIIDGDGIIRFAYVNPDYRTRLGPDVLLAAARDAASESGAGAPAR